MEFALEVRQAILRERPQVIALELPATLQPAWMRAIARLPAMSLIFYPDDSKSEDSEAVYVLVEPADPFTEAIRTGLEIGAEIVFADPEAGERPHVKDAYPDSYAIRHIGLERYVEAYRVYPAAALRGNRAPRRRHRLETARLPTHPPASSWWSPSICSTLCWTPWRNRKRSRSARTWRDGIELLNPHPESLAEIATEYPQLQWRYEQFRASDARCRLNRPPPRATGHVPRRRKRA